MDSAGFSTDHTKSQHFFKQLQAADFVDVPKARIFFERSGLSDKVLTNILRIADKTQDGRLDFSEFCLAFEMVAAAARRRAAETAGKIMESNELVPTINVTKVRSQPASPVHFIKHSNERRSSYSPNQNTHEGSVQNLSRSTKWNFSDFATTIPRPASVPSDGKSLQRDPSLWSAASWGISGTEKPSRITRQSPELLHDLHQKRNILHTLKADVEQLKAVSSKESEGFIETTSRAQTVQRLLETATTEQLRKSSGLNQLNVSVAGVAADLDTTSLTRRALELELESVRASVSSVGLDGTRLATNKSSDELDQVQHEIDITVQRTSSSKQKLSSVQSSVNELRTQIGVRRQRFRSLQSRLSKLHQENRSVMDIFETKRDAVSALVTSNVVDGVDILDAGQTSDQQEHQSFVAVADFEPASENEIPLRTGDEVSVLQRGDDEWWLGKCSGMVGYFPANYVQPKEELVLCEMTAMYDFPASNPDEMTIQAGDVVEILPRDSTDEGWLFGRLKGTNSTGIVPANYLQQQESMPRRSAGLEDAAVSDSESLLRQKAIDELLQSEKVYLADMQSVVEIFYGRLSSSGTCSLTELEEMFTGWEDLIIHSVQLISAIESADPVSIAIGSVLTSHLPPPEPYVSFCSRQTKIGELIIRKSSTNPKFDEILRFCSTDSRLMGLPLSAAYVKPMQRITRYPLLIKRIAEATANNHPDHQKIHDALKLAESLCGHVNEGVRSSESSQRMEWLEEHIDMTDLDEVFKFNSLTNNGKQRVLLHAGSLVKAKSGRELVGFLFSDIFLLTTPLKAVSTSNGGFSFEKKSWASSKLKLYKKPLRISRCTATSAADQSSFVVSFSDGVTLNLKTVSVVESRTWVKKIVEASRMELVTRPAPRIPKNPEGCCRVIVVEAADLTSDPRKKRCDPFCKITLGSQETRTKVVEDSFRPRWDHNMNFVAYDLENEVMIVTVWDYNPYAPNRFLGRTEVKLKDVLRSGKFPGIPVLIKSLLREVDSGEIVLKVDVQRFSPG